MKNVKRPEPPALDGNYQSCIARACWIEAELNSGRMDPKVGDVMLKCVRTVMANLARLHQERELEQAKEALTQIQKAKAEIAAMTNAARKSGIDIDEKV